MSASIETSPTWSNWTGSRVVPIARDVTPSDEAGVVSAISEALAGGETVRTAGRGYSWAESVGEGSVVVRTDALQGVRDIDLGAGTARVAAGTSLADLCLALWRAGAELPSLGGFSGQTVGGAVATATHGTGLSHRCLSAYAQGFRIANADAEIVTVGKGDEEWLRAARVGLGMLGVVTELTLEIQPASWLRIEDSWHDRLAPEWLTVDDGVRRAARWYPDADGDVRANSKFHLREWVPARAGSEGALPSFTALATAGNVRPATFSVVEHSIPLAQVAEVVAAVERVLSDQPETLTGMPLALRNVASDDAFLSPYQGGPMLTLSAAATSLEQGGAMYELVHDVLLGYGARPHWAKDSLYQPELLKSRYTDLGRFDAVRRQFDTRDMFLTPFQAALMTKEHADGLGGVIEK
ncbi:D-arabinono-1,4-lactone oxidase [Microbacterium sp. A93]|uniref:D-arabinono-1,4-lactone oxidase n=1 Tax=Microbacterium sp. A93 TaxID=3450716 RepID=UPI003F444EFF